MAYMRPARAISAKDPEELNDYECTMLARIPNAPSVYSPDVNPDLARQRRQQVIGCMIEEGYIEEGQINELKSQILWIWDFIFPCIVYTGVIYMIVNGYAYPTTVHTALNWWLQRHMAFGFQLWHYRGRQTDCAG